jgi:hypothetical protein
LKAGTHSTLASLRGALTALLFVARATHAQRVETNLDVGGAALRYADTLSTGAATITPHVVADWTSTLLEASGTYSQFTAGGWSMQGSVSASRFTPNIHGLFGEVGGFAGGSTHNDGTRTGEAIANGRLHVTNSSGELYFGGGGGRTWDGIAWRSVLLGEAGASISTGSSSALVSLTPTVVNDSIKYTDAQASLAWKLEAVDFSALLGFRIGDQLTTLGTNARSWASVSAVYWMTTRLGIVVGGGTYPVDPTQGFPGGRFVSLGLRAAPWRRSNPPSIAQVGRGSTSTAPDLASAVSGFAVKRVNDDMVTIRVDAPNGRLVEVNGDFTNWVPVQLVPAGAGSWSTTLPIRSGKYQMNVRVDGGPWIVPPGLLSMVDEFGGAVGLLVIE